VYRNDRENGRGGGVLLYVRDVFNSKQIVWPEDIQLECVGVDVSLSSSMSFTIICVYRKPSAKLDFYEKFEKLLKYCTLNKETIIIGDFNVNWNDKKARKHLKVTTDRHNFKQLIQQPTRITSRSETLIDLLFVNRPERIA